MIKFAHIVSTQKANRAVQFAFILRVILKVETLRCNNQTMQKHWDGGRAEGRGQVALDMMQ